MEEQEKIINSGLLEQYVLGLLEGEELARVERYLEQYPELRDYTQELERVMEHVLQENGIQPPLPLREKVLSEIDKTTTPPSTVKNNAFNFRPMPILAAAAAIGLVLLSISFFFRQQDSSNNYDNLERKYRALEQRCQQDLAVAVAERDLLSSEATRAILLKSNPSEIYAIVHYNEESEQVLLQTIGLPEPPSGKQYQLWADVEGEMISMGVVPIGVGSLQEMTFVGEAESLNLTLEPLGGSEHASVDQLQANGKV